jgi:hypothetical protein
VAVQKLSYFCCAGPALAKRNLLWRNQSTFNRFDIRDVEGVWVMLWSGWSPPIVPYGADQTVYLVLETPRPECTSRQTAIERTDLETVITDLMSGRFDDPIGILAFNTLEHWADDLSKDVAREIQCRCDIEGDDIPDHLVDFVGRSISRADS